MITVTNLLGTEMQQREKQFCVCVCVCVCVCLRACVRFEPQEGGNSFSLDIHMNFGTNAAPAAATEHDEVMGRFVPSLTQVFHVRSADTPKQVCYTGALFLLLHPPFFFLPSGEGNALSLHT